MSNIYKIISVKINTKWIVANTTSLISPAGHHPSDRKIGIKKGTILKQYSCPNQKTAERLALIDFPSNVKELMLWNVEKHYANY
tara:strand:- start:71 stop:322 length:252 start_codon:yes stop_codon:yes gene_type:complete